MQLTKLKHFCNIFAQNSFLQTCPWPLKSSNPTSLPMSCTYLLRYLWLTQAFAPNLELSTNIRRNGNTFVALTRPLDPLVRYFKLSLSRCFVDSCQFFKWKSTYFLFSFPYYTTTVWNVYLGFMTFHFIKFGLTHLNILSPYSSFSSMLG